MWVDFVAVGFPYGMEANDEAWGTGQSALRLSGSRWVISG